MTWKTVFNRHAPTVRWLRRLAAAPRQVGRHSVQRSAAGPAKRCLCRGPPRRTRAPLGRPGRPAARSPVAAPNALVLLAGFPAGPPVGPHRKIRSRVGVYFPRRRHASRLSYRRNGTRGFVQRVSPSPAARPTLSSWPTPQSTSPPRLP